MQNFARKLLHTFAAAVLAASFMTPLLGSAQAADVASHSRLVRPAPALPFPRSERAQSVWASAQCWSECGAYTAWDLVACLERDSQGQCLKRADRADRYCQRECRTSGGPLLPLDF
jgi:hypothetical protein